jgi:hypothetical protein
VKFIPELVEDARDWWRWWSMRLMAAGLFLLSLLEWFPDAAWAVWGRMPDDMKAMIPASVATKIPMFLFAAAMVARLIQQRTTQAKPNPPQ